LVLVESPVVFLVVFQVAFPVARPVHLVLLVDLQALLVFHH
jgi:hypothetical protein